MGIKLINAEKKKYRVAFWHENRHYTKVVMGNKKLAQEVETKMRHDLSIGTYFPKRLRQAQSLKKVSELYLAQEKARRERIPFRSLTYYVGKIRKFFGDRLLDEITPKDVLDFRISLSKTNGAIGQNRHQQVLCRIFNWAKAADFFKSDNPASSEKVPYESERKFWRTRFLSQDELRRLLNCAHPRIKPIILTAVFTGMRFGEIKKMRKKDVNLDKCVILIPETKTGEPGWVPITETLYEILKPILQILPDPENLVLDFLNFRRLWWKALRDAKLKGLHFHDLRHTFASHLMMKTGNPAAVQGLLRHKTPAMTQRYAHLAPDFMRNAALTLDGHLGLGDVKDENTGPPLSAPQPYAIPNTDRLPA